jgi:hypothetical protein
LKDMCAIRSVGRILKFIIDALYRARDSAQEHAVSGLRSFCNFKFGLENRGLSPEDDDLWRINLDTSIQLTLGKESKN